MADFQAEIDSAIKEKKLYFLGDSLPRDWYEAFRLWLPLAEEGNAKAQYNIGRCYNRGDGIDQDSVQAEKWYRRSAEQKDPRALFNLYLFLKDVSASRDSSETAESFLIEAVALREPRANREIASREAAIIEALRAEEIALELAKKQAAQSNKNILEKSTSDRLREMVRLGKKTEALALAQDVRKQGITSFDNLIACLSLSIESIVISDTRTHSQVTAGGVINGSTAYHNIKTNFVKITATVKNQSEHWANFKFEITSDSYVGWWGGAVLNGDGLRASPTNISTFTSNELMRGFKIAAIRTTDTQWLIQLDSPFVCKESSTGSSAKCFVVTVCFGNESHPVVAVFRNFRDQRLATNRGGRSFIAWYYAYGPRIAEAVDDSPVTKKLLRQLLLVVSKLLPKT
jgi:Sel1 repeat